MGLYSRDYYRELNTSPWGFEGAPVVKYVILVNVVVFLLQVFVVRPPQLSQKEAMEQMAAKKGEPPTEAQVHEIMRATQRLSVVQEWLELDSGKVMGGQVWRLLTHAFCHDRYSVFHILFNMIALYWFGRTLEIMFGSREFLLFYLAGALFAALAYVGLDLYTGSPVPAVGASGAVMAVLMLYAVHFPRETICYCWFFPLEVRWLVALYVIWDLHPVLLALSGDRMFTGVAHAAHLGGLAFGFVYGWYEWRLEPILDRLPGLGRWADPRPRVRPARRACPVPGAARSGPDAHRLDEVLEKISRSGRDSLTAEEEAVLQTASRQLKTRARSG